MKKFRFTSILSFVIILSVVFLKAQDSARVIIISNAVGETIDQTEKEHYHLLPSVKNFVSAAFYRAPDSTYFAQVEIIDDKGQQSLIKVDYSEVSLFMLAEKINHYKDLVAGNYVMGQDPAKIQIVGGPEVGWTPPPPRPKELHLAQEGSSLPITSSSKMDTSENIPSFEVRVSGGYGFAQGGESGHERRLRFII